MGNPKSIQPCPIIEALFELRFTSRIPSNAIFGMIYGVLQDKFPNAENLPILQIPEALRAKDPNFRFKPHYKIANSQLAVQIGPEVLSISCYPKYLGWNALFSEIISIIDEVKTLNIINNVERIGLRYINFFENNIFENIDLNISLKQEPINYKNTVIKTEIVEEQFKSILQIANNQEYDGKQGSFIDIDTISINDVSNFFVKKENLISLIHDTEKSVFYNLLNQDFLNTLNPEY